jgi:hypothetical protein
MIAGDYPALRYRGAEALEMLYERDGQRVAQELIASFRADPPLAQERFEALMATVA